MPNTMLPVAPPPPATSQVKVPTDELKLTRRASRRYGLFAPQLLKAALRQSFVMLRPDIQWKNPVMFVVEVGTVLSIIFTFVAGAGQLAYLIQLDVWLLATVLFANFATALAEARGKAQADSLRKTRQETPALSLRKYEAGRSYLRGADEIEKENLERTNSTLLKAGDVVLVEAGEVTPGDGEIVEGVASVDESAITGE